MERKAMSRKKQPNLSGPLRPMRVRLEFSVFRQTKPPQQRFLADRKIIALRVLLQERFGVDGAQAYLDWLASCVADQETVTALRHGGG